MPLEVFIYRITQNIIDMKKLVIAMATALLTLGACSTQDGEKQEAATSDINQAAIENIMTRTSIRKYKDQPVEQEKIDIMLKAAMAAPTAVNLQPWHFIVIDDKKTIDLLSSRQPTNAPLLIAVCVATPTRRQCLTAKANCPTSGFRMYRLLPRTCCSLLMPWAWVPFGLAYIPLWNAPPKSPMC